MMIKMFYLTVAGILMMALGSFLASLMVAGGMAMFIGVLGMVVVGLDRSF